jgi:hypothetical protein
VWEEEMIIALEPVIFEIVLMNSVLDAGLLIKDLIPEHTLEVQVQLVLVLVVLLVESAGSFWSSNQITLSFYFIS